MVEKSFHGPYSFSSFANLLTAASEVHKDDKYLIPLKKDGIFDIGLLAATLVVAYFNFVNCIVLAFGLETNEKEMEGYKY